jgi:biotin-[acetyl-CoA-carboxylase] ligase BirA-like protein
MPTQFKIISFDSIDSTNEEAKRRIKSGDISDRVLITSKVQTSGKGRYSKGWVSADGNMFATIVIRINNSLNEAALYSFVTAISVGEAIKDFINDDITVQYKWPNDVMLDGKKLSGILLETLKDSNGCNWLIIGTGVKSFNISCSEASTANNKLLCSPHAHNLYLEILINTGIFGILIFIIYIFNMLKDVKSILSKHNNTIYLYLLIIFIAELFPFRSYGSIFQTVNGSMFWYLLALTSVIKFREKLIKY